jgi:hypothetical protein
VLVAVRVIVSAPPEPAAVRPAPRLRLVRG